MNLSDLFATVKNEADITLDIAKAYYEASDEEKGTISEDAAKWTLQFISNLPDGALNQPKTDEVVAEQTVNAEAAVVINSETNIQTTDIIEPGNEQIITVENHKREVVNEETQSTSTTESVTITVQTYTQEQVNTMIAEQTAPLQAKIQELEALLKTKDESIEAIKINANKIADLKIEYAANEFTADFADEDWLNTEKLEEAKQAKTRKELIATTKTELQDNEFAQNFSDEDYLNADKVENAKLQLKIKTLEAKKEETIEAKKDDLETGHQETISSNVNIVAKVIRAKRNR